MSLKNNEFLSQNNIKLLVLALTVLTGLSGVMWWKHEQSQQLKLKSEIAERERIRKAFRQAGIAAAKIQQAQSKPPLQEDELAPHELSDEGELAQAKLWQSLPKNKRDIMLNDTINAGLAAANKEQPSP